jgi:hypothetical protein
MPDFRVTMIIGALAPGVAPAAVLPAAKAAASELTLVEASDLAVVAGEARVTIRFEADDDELAAQIAAHIVAVTRDVAEVTGHRATRRVGGRWVAVRQA